MSPRHLLTLILILLIRGHTLAELKFGTPRWGFDGTVSKNTFNLLSIEIRNTGSAAFDGEITLDENTGRSTAPYRVRAFISPGSVRWVQFFPFIGSYVPSDWTISWREGKRDASIGLNDTGERLKEGPPAIVILAAVDDPTLRATRIPVFDESLFPPTVAATDALHAVILDHIPKLDPARREAFLDWIRAGGIVHLIPGPDGVFPAFTDDLAPLSFTADTATLGAGLIAKHTVSRSEITPDFLATAGYARPALAGDKDSNDWRSDTSRFTSNLAALTRPNIPWSLIYLLTVLYVALIGPAFYFLRKRDYRILLGGFLLTVASFAWLFTVVGRRGYGEKQIHHTIGVARHLGGGRYDLRQWVHAFATSGDRYTLAFPGTGHLYSAASTAGDAVRASVLHGKDAALIADIPLFSSRPFIHRGIVTAADPAFTIAEFARTGGTLTTLKITLPAGFPAFLEAAAEFRDTAYRIHRTGDTLHLGPSTTLPGALHSSAKDQDQIYYSYYNAPSPATARQTLVNSAAILASYITPTQDRTRHQPGARPPRPDTLRLYIYTTEPAFTLRSDRFQPGTHLTLFTYDLPIHPAN